MDSPSGAAQVVAEGKRAGFWPRFAATWVDSFIIYAAASFLIALAGAVAVRVALEPLYLSLAALYGAVLVGLRGQTPGKLLLGIAVVTRGGQSPGLRRALVREVLGKWGLAVVLPLASFRASGWPIAPQGWVSTLYDTFALLPGLFLLSVLYLVTKRTWYDWLAGTKVERVSRKGQFARPALIALLGAALLVLGTMAAEYAVHGWIPCRLALFRNMRSTAPYAAFLRQSQATPVDYVIGLFNRYDVVVLSERAHPEATQWDFIIDVVRDPRFVERVGHVFTEYGQTGTQARMDSFMAADGLTAREVHERILAILRHPAVWPVWTNTNWYSYLKRLYALNQSLPQARRIRHHLTDGAIDWSKFTTREHYQAYRSTLRDRDEQMARCVIDEMRRLAAAESRRPKCLVVMNYRHGFDLTGRSPVAKRMNTYEFLKDSFGDHAANVLLNADILLTAPIAGGVWDAAFEETGRRPVGFDFAGSPFGEDPFDMFPFQPGVKAKLRYRQAFTGYVYVNPPAEQYLQFGVSGYYAGFEGEALRRAALLGADYRKKIEADIALEERREAKVLVRSRPIYSLIELSRLGVTEAGVAMNAEPLLELLLLGLNSVGLLIGVGAYLSRRQTNPT